MLLHLSKITSCGIVVLLAEGDLITIGALVMREPRVCLTFGYMRVEPPKRSAFGTDEGFMFGLTGATSETTPIILHFFAQRLVADGPM